MYENISGDETIHMKAGTRWTPHVVFLNKEDNDKKKQRIGHALGPENKNSREKKVSPKWNAPCTEVPQTCRPVTSAAPQDMGPPNREPNVFVYIRVVRGANTCLQDIRNGSIEHQALRSCQECRTDPDPPMRRRVRHQGQRQSNPRAVSSICHCLV